MKTAVDTRLHPTALKTQANVDIAFCVTTKRLISLEFYARTQFTKELFVCSRNVHPSQSNLCR